MLVFVAASDICMQRIYNNTCCRDHFRKARKETKKKACEELFSHRFYPKINPKNILTVDLCGAVVFDIRQNSKIIFPANYFY